MDEPLRNLTGPQVVGILALILGSVSLTTIVLASIVVPYSKRVRQVEIEAQLKRDMIAAGFTASDIERVVRVTTTDRTESEAQRRPGSANTNTATSSVSSECA